MPQSVRLQRASYPELSGLIRGPPTKGASSGQSREKCKGLRFVVLCFVVLLCPLGSVVDLEPSVTANDLQVLCSLGFFLRGNNMLGLYR